MYWPIPLEAFLTSSNCALSEPPSEPSAICDLSDLYRANTQMISPLLWQDTINLNGCYSHIQNTFGLLHWTNLTCLLTSVLIRASLSPSCVWRRTFCLRSSSTSSLSSVSSSVCNPFTCEPSPWLWFSLPEIILWFEIVLWLFYI